MSGANRLRLRDRLAKVIPSDDRVAVRDGELAVLIVCNLVSTVGLAGDIARHLLEPDSLDNDFLSGWHLVLYGGVFAVGLWLGLGAVRRGPAFLGASVTTLIGFVLLSIGGAADLAWHEQFGTEVAVEALVSPPHLVVFAGLAFLLTSPIVILWRRPTTRLGWVPSVSVVVSVVSAVLVTMLFTGFLSPLAGGMSLQAGYVEPLVGESLQDYDQVRGLGIAVWTVTVLVAAFSVVLVRFRLQPGLLTVGFLLIGIPAIQISDGVEPLLAGLLVAGLVTEVLVAILGRPTLGRGSASLVGAALGASLWATTFALLASEDRLAWTEALWGGAITLSALVGAAVAGLVALPAPTGETYVDTPMGPLPR